MSSFLDTVVMALGTLRANVLRSILTLLGIVIGASTVVAMMSFTEGLRIKMTTDFAQLGAGAFQVQKWPAMSFGPRDWRKIEARPDLTREQGEALRDLPHIKAVSIEEWLNGLEKLATSERTTKQNVNICGGLPDYESANGVTVAEGRFIIDTDIQLGRRVVFVGADVAEALFPGESALGREVRLRGVPFEVIGIAQREGAILGQSKDAFAVIPWPSFERVFGKRRNNNIALVATTPDDVDKALDEVIAKLRRIRGLAPQEENNFDYFSNDTSTELFNNLAAMVAAATGGVCALALLVGGIGIMNIMLVSVTERTREIGVRLAVGARAGDILAQFLVEAIILSALGGVIGVGVGLVGAYGVAHLIDVPFVVPRLAIPVAFGVSVLVGIVFGAVPARKASHLSPLGALRFE